MNTYVWEYLILEPCVMDQKTIDHEIFQLFKISYILNQEMNIETLPSSLLIQPILPIFALTNLPFRLTIKQLNPFMTEAVIMQKPVPLICGANQWTGFYMITASVLKVFKVNKLRLLRTRSLSNWPMEKFYTTENVSSFIGGFYEHSCLLSDKF